VKPAPTAAEIADARAWIARVGASQGYTEECALVILSALDAAEARADRQTRALKEQIDFTITLQRRVESAEAHPWDYWHANSEAMARRAETAERERDEARAALPPGAIVVADTEETVEKIAESVQQFAQESLDGVWRVRATPDQVARAVLAALREAGK
jgi:flagellum-specific peptidoglycan hydrolase FlgJ